MVSYIVMWQQQPCTPHPVAAAAAAADALSLHLTLLL
jgi:hypothetical protein